ncbi:carboxymuconolactone decarboxylase family protein [Ensifer adhaerens]|uniref:carboxymuconolactone decarboxylase family protein n=1 Tax=Ensifer adhaerens TaxID=106592 RepID=UPI001CC1465D|nr:carboxymuconolactone decarboxylase family protein [Ensifer adhaerens]MBZ7927727.1 carboxymuconolactone decarboxylase family protein [Ensifer adhaerens]UAX96630.1 carboxymuconolactone decarboxylase family protein [Ensifer adhaerens]UAY04026.1 carboxymuconolactone decarboxylase family protein [Ensifer adhaerens]UAY12012.1 carboxymuconolactone decarboxylase family protein [Ensifer adhaerens]
MTSRPPVLDETSLSAEQREIYNAIASGPRGVVEGPLRVWLQRPGLAAPAQALGAYCRYGTSLPRKLSELAIIVTGAHWQAGFEWYIHAPIAIEVGVPSTAVDAIYAGQRPLFDDIQMTAVYDFTTELLETRAISDATYEFAEKALGADEVVDLVGILGYYALISMTIKAFRVPVPSGEIEPFPRPKT